MLSLGACFCARVHEIETEVTAADKRTKMESVVGRGMGRGGLLLYQNNKDFKPAPPSDVLAENHWASAGTSFCH